MLYVVFVSYMLVVAAGPLQLFYVTAAAATTTTTPFNGLFSGTTWESRYLKGKTSVDLNEA